MEIKLDVVLISVFMLVSVVGAPIAHGQHTGMPADHGQTDFAQTESPSENTSSLDATFGGIIRGEVPAGLTASENASTIDVRGNVSVQYRNETRYPDSVVLVIVGPGGNATAYEITAEQGTFEEEDLSFSEMDRGMVSAHVISHGVDFRYGSGLSARDLEYRIEDDISPNTTTGDELRNQIRSVTVDAPGSDDKMVSTTFQFANASTTIQRVYPEGGSPEDTDVISRGDSIVVEGITNRRPDMSAIGVEVTDKSGNDVTIPQTGSSTYTYNYTLPEQGDVNGTSIGTSQWEANGMWEATLNTSSLESGTYTIQSNTGYSIDQVSIRIGNRNQSSSPVNRSARDQVQIEDVTLDPSSVSANTTNDHTLTFDVTNVSDDGNTDSFTVTTPNTTTLDSANSVSVVDADGDNVSLSSEPDMSGNQITFSVAPDSSANFRNLTVTADGAVTAPNVSSETTVDFSIEVSDSDNGQDSATTTLTIQSEGAAPADPTERALQIAGKNNSANLTQDDVTAAITQFNRGQQANGADITQDDVTTVITLFERN